MSQFQSEIGAAETYEEMELIIQRVLGRSGFMHFARFDLGAILRKEGKQLTPKILRILIGNPLVMKEMVNADKVTLTARIIPRGPQTAGNACGAVGSQVDRAFPTKVLLISTPRRFSERYVRNNFCRHSARRLASPKECYAQKNRPTQ
jgi:hypothetical protein